MLKYAQRIIAVLAASIFASCLASTAASAAQATPAAKNGNSILAQTQRAAKRRAPRKVLPKNDPDDDGKSARLWRLTRDAMGPVLTFGHRNGDAIVTFSCQPGSGEIRVIAYTASRGTRRGDAARLRFTNGRQRLEIAGTAFADGRQDRIDVGGVTSATMQFLELFRSGETMIVEVPGRKVGVSLKTLGKKAEQFAAVCK